jgi:hypothetical protein
MVKEERTGRVFDTKDVWDIAHETDTDIRSVRREIEARGSVRGRAGDRIRRAIARRLEHVAGSAGGPGVTSTRNSAPKAASRGAA